MLGFLLFADWFRRLSAAAASRIILCYAFVDSLRLPLDNRFFTVVRDILSVKARVCVCVCDEIKASLSLYLYFSMSVS